MAGRYGSDQLNNALLLLAIVLMVIEWVMKWNWMSMFILALFILCYFRMFSRNVYKRREENGKYMRLKYKAAAELRLFKERWIPRKDYKFFTCPSCRASLRVPRHRGKIKIVCRKCGTSFFGKT